MNAFAALADDTRREIVRLVAKNGELTSTEIGENFNITAPAISHHLKVLKSAKLLNMKKEAQKRIYSLNGSSVSEMEDWILEIIDLWKKRLDKLDRYVLKLKKERTRDKK
ncbi:metalloregulator ArsR/SmtB family transcription factor [Leptospira sp. WS58.C1]|uniref:metalloregulator ArsR/SmtB family transcription factor n=1 Tax=Leptospira TaxID=171 RepID=UPI0002BFD920|nr:MULTISPECIES: metalloregulator ArsR/SmtB family transcription factor [unclassified Leptospira]EMJ97412.1 transcriptional regulator, ArsR family [Leptospira sp. B5-022]MCR1793214.1 metalloregulator ArsR/SmtB family transcription factor [Leptospira sp. id769339]